MQFKRWVLALGLASGCVSDEIETTEQEIIGGSAASPWQARRAAIVSGCTATRLNAQWIVTAAHCQVARGETAIFYDDGPTVSGRSAEVEQVVLRPGVTASRCADEDLLDCTDDAGLFADIALVRLQASSSVSENATSGATAALAWSYHNDVWGTRVGAGNHDGEVNTGGRLEQEGDWIDDETDSDGEFLTDTDESNKGDSGGPIYNNANQIMGVLFGSGSNLWDGTYNKYTSASRHLDWILDTIGYRWAGQPVQSNTTLSGTNLETIINSSHKRCQYACEKTGSCDGYIYNSTLDTCTLVGNPTGASTANGLHAALKHGASSGRSAYVVGYARSDGYNSVLREASNGDMHELFLGSGNWGVATLVPGAPVITSKITPYRRADGKNVVVYRSNAHIVELAWVNNAWTWFDLSYVAGAPDAVGSPTAYVNADGVNAVVYRDAAGHIHELSMGTRGWRHTDLTTASGVANYASSDPSAFVRSDGFSSVTYRSDTHVVELFKAPGYTWGFGFPSYATGAPAASSRPFGYTRSNGSNAIVYRSGSSIIELTNTSSGWEDLNITSGGAAATGDPMAYVRTDGVESVLYRSSGGAIFELAKTSSWGAYDLTWTAGAPSAATDPAVYIRDDGYNAVVYRAASNSHVTELAWKRGGPNWNDGDLTAISGETP